MKTLLRIDTSIRQTDSISRMMGDYFVTQWKKKYPAGRIVVRDLQQRPVPHLTQSTVQAFFGGKVAGEGLSLSNQLIDEIMSADEVLITCPMYNFQIPSSLKAYFDHIVRVNKTFQVKDGVYAGLIKSKRCIIITTMGGMRSNADQEESFEHYLRGILGFVGIHDVELYSLDGTTNPDYIDQLMVKVKSEITNQMEIV